MKPTTTIETMVINSDNGTFSVTINRAMDIEINKGHETLIADIIELRAILEVAETLTAQFEGGI